MAEEMQGSPLRHLVLHGKVKFTRSNARLQNIVYAISIQISTSIVQI